MRQGHGYINQQHHEPNQQHKGQQSSAEARERFYDETLELWWKLHRCVPRSYGDDRDHSQAVAMPSVASASKPHTGPPLAGMNADIGKAIMQKTIRGTEVHLKIFD